MPQRHDEQQCDKAGLEQVEDRVVVGQVLIGIPS